jgi:hypothetical protein
MSLRALSTLSTTVSSVSKNNADVPGVTFCFTSSMNLSLIPMSMIEVLQAPSAAKGGAEKRHEKDQPEEHSPEGAAERTFAGRVVQLTGFRLLLAEFPADHGRVVDGDRRLGLQSLQPFDGFVSVVGTGKGPPVSVVIEVP